MNRFLPLIVVGSIVATFAIAQLISWINADDRAQTKYELDCAKAGGIVVRDRLRYGRLCVKTSGIIEVTP